MGRPPKFTSEQILDAAAAVVAEAGPDAATVGAIAERLGAPSGSIYHRFASRDLILAQLWIRTVRRSQEGFLAALEGDDLDDSVDAALHALRWSRRHAEDARVLLLYRREDLARRWPEELGGELATLNEGIAGALRAHARRRFGRADRELMRRITFALVDVPYAAVRRPLLAGETPPRALDALVGDVVRQLLADEPDRLA